MISRALNEEAKVSAFLDVLYGAAVEPELRPTALDQARQLFEGNGCHLAAIDLATGVATKPHWVGNNKLDDLLAHGDTLILDDPWMNHLYGKLDDAIASEQAHFDFHGAEHARQNGRQLTHGFGAHCRAPSSVLIPPQVVGTRHHRQGMMNIANQFLCTSQPKTSLQDVECR